MPSISAILGATADQTALKKWQEMMIKQMGVAGFRAWMRRRVTTGMHFHESMEVLAISACEGVLEASDDSSILSQTEKSARGYVASALPLLRSLALQESYAQLPLFERNVTHPTLAYQGRFDALLPLREGGLTLIDWKTASADSAIAKAAKKRESTALRELYSYPAQLAAYIGAFNASAEFDAYPQIDRAVIVIANENGERGRIIDIHGEQLEKAWQDWTNKVHAFWRVVNASDDKNESTVDVRM